VVVGELVRSGVADNPPVVGETPNLASRLWLNPARLFRRSLEVYAKAPEDISSLGVIGSQEVISLALGGGVHFVMGQPELGQAAITQSIALARTMQHASSIALALVTELLTPIPGGLNPDPGRAEDLVRFCAQHGLKNFEAWPSSPAARSLPDAATCAKALA